MGLFDLLVNALGVGTESRFALDDDNVLWAEMALKRAGIKMTGKMIVDGKFIFDVPSDKIEQARKELRDRGLY